jgi:hypothetical protein
LVLFQDYPSQHFVSETIQLTPLDIDSNYLVASRRRAIPVQDDLRRGLEMSVIFVLFRGVEAVE